MRTINVKGISQPLNFPDNMSDAEISQAIQRNLPQLKAQYPEKIEQEKPPAPRTAPTENMTDRASQALLNPSTPEQNREFLANVGMAAVPPLRFAKYLPEGANIAKGLLNFGTDVAQNAALSAGANAIEGKSPTEGALTGAGTAAVINPLLQTFQSGNPLVRLGGAGALGLLGTMGVQQIAGTNNSVADLVGAGIGAGLGLRGRNARDLAVMNLLKDVDLPRAMPRIEAAERLGLKYLRPSEAMDSGYIGSIEGNVGITPETSLFLERQGEARKATEKASIKNLYDTTFKDEELSPQVDKLYRQSYQQEIPYNTYNAITNSATIQKAMKEVDSSPIYQDALQGVPKTSFAYLDQVKRRLDGMQKAAAKAGNKDEALLIKSAKLKFVKKLDSINQTYKAARQLSQREIVKNNMRKALNDSEIKGISFYNKLLKNDDKFDKLHNSLRNVPEAQQQLSDMRDVFRTLVDSTKPARTGVKLAETHITSPRSSGELLGRFMQRLQGGAYDKAMAELMTNPKWYKEVARAKQMAEPNEKARVIANAISRITGRKVQDVLY